MGPEDGGRQRSAEFARLLERSSAGDGEAASRLSDITYGELHGLAAALLAREHDAHTLQATALVHEAWLRLLGGGSARPEERGRFLALASGVMRRVLVDYARAHQAQKRGGGARRIALEPSIAGEDDLFADVVAVDQALDRLATLSERQARIVERRFFGGLEMEEIARELCVSLSTVEREWRVARAFLEGELRAGD